MTEIRDRADMEKELRAALTVRIVFENDTDLARVRDAFLNKVADELPDLDDAGRVWKRVQKNVSVEVDEDTGNKIVMLQLRMGWPEGGGRHDHAKARAIRTGLKELIENVNKAGVLEVRVTSHECPHYSTLPMGPCKEEVLYEWSAP